MSDLDFYNEDDLLGRLAYEWKMHIRDVVFLAGSALTAAEQQTSKGVLTAADIVERIQSEFVSDKNEFAALSELISSHEANKYQEAFRFLLGRRSQDFANELIKRAVTGALHDPSTLSSQSISDDDCRQLEEDPTLWRLPPAVDALGRIVTAYSSTFGSLVLTSNFDPLIEVSIKSHGGRVLQTVMHRDGNINQTRGDGCHIIHFHGYWHGADTLHTTRQLGQQRPRLQASLTEMLRKKTVVVLGYGGWDDILTKALADAVLDDSSSPEILWCFYKDLPTPDSKLPSLLEGGLDRGRVKFYKNINCHTFLPKLDAHLQSSTDYKSSERLSPQLPNQPVPTKPQAPSKSAWRAKLKKIFNSDYSACDRPPNTEYWVGREYELQRLLSSRSSVVYVSGIAGQGKSSLAAKYLDKAVAANQYQGWDWRDCKEEANRFHTYLVKIIDRLSDGGLDIANIANQSIADVSDIFIGLAAEKKWLFVFDNIDHYIDLQKLELSGEVQAFVKRVPKRQKDFQILFTFRPEIEIFDTSHEYVHIEGLSLDEAEELFKNRGARSATKAQISDSHHLTKGHAFWLDLIAIQTARGLPDVSLDRLNDGIRNGTGDLPESTLSSIWTNLPDREKVVLRILAETVRPETHDSLAKYAAEHLNHNQFDRALRAVKRLNLIVTKTRANEPDLYELHPLIREFVRRVAPPQERASTIQHLISFYKLLTTSGGATALILGRGSNVELWTQRAELEVAAGNYDAAFETLYSVNDEFTIRYYPEEYARVCRKLLSNVSWRSASTDYKKFHEVLIALIECYVHLGRDAEALSLLDDYGKLFEDRKDARYIGYCDIRCYSHWFMDDFDSAVGWGTTGRDLKQRTGVDTAHDCRHHLALAQRDAGQVDEALKYFLNVHTLDSVLLDDTIIKDRTGEFYGNIGRCLQLQGRFADALLCYRKSAQLLEQNERVSWLNQAYARQWIGEVFFALHQMDEAHYFLLAAKKKWRSIAPSRAVVVEELLEDLIRSPGSHEIRAVVDPEFACEDWIYAKKFKIV
jgi:tetratricopeptide (TPR) repeat protein